MVVDGAEVLPVVGSWVVVVGFWVTVISVVDLAAVVVEETLLAELMIEPAVGNGVIGIPGPLLVVVVVTEVTRLVDVLDTGVAVAVVDAARPLVTGTIEEPAPAVGLNAMSTLELAPSASCSSLK